MKILDFIKKTTAAFIYAIGTLVLLFYSINSTGWRYYIPLIIVLTPPICGLIVCTIKIEVLKSKLEEQEDE